jgi:hypothetical protein
MRAETAALAVICVVYYPKRCSDASYFLGLRGERVIWQFFVTRKYNRIQLQRVKNSSYTLVPFQKTATGYVYTVDTAGMS